MIPAQQQERFQRLPRAIMQKIVIPVLLNHRWDHPATVRPRFSFSNVNT
jgi:hypothetical protein